MRERRGSRFGDFVLGVKYLGRGLGWVARRPGQWLFGLVPALITLVLYVVAFVLLAVFIDDLASWVTPFADDWSDGARQSMRVFAGVVLFGAGAFLAILAFTGVTLLIGDPFYERISKNVEDSMGGAPPEVDSPVLAQIGRAVGDTLILIAVALPFTIIFFALGFVPVIGQTVIPVLAACVSGYFLTGELTSVPMERRGLYRRDRFALLKRDRPVAVGFGAATFVLFFIPLGAVFAMPGAVAGATIMTRERLAAQADGPLKAIDHSAPRHYQ